MLSRYVESGVVARLARAIAKSIPDARTLAQSTSVPWCRLMSIPKRVMAEFSLAPRPERLGPGPLLPHAQRLGNHGHDRGRDDRRHRRVLRERDRVERPAEEEGRGRRSVDREG